MPGQSAEQSSPSVTTTTCERAFVAFMGPLIAPTHHPPIQLKQLGALGLGQATAAAVHYNGITQSLNTLLQYIPERILTQILQSSTMNAYRLL